jgi:hypothetical protein
MNNNRIDCDEFANMAPELALGILSGNERATALGHLAGCASCRERLDDLARVADNLLLLAPAKEPPIGFESRVLGRLQAAGAGMAEGAGPAPVVHPRWAPHRRLLVLAAAAAIVVAGVTTGLVATSGGGHAPVPTSVTRVLWAGQSTCQMVAFAPTTPGGPTVVMVRLVEVGESDGPYPVFVEPVKGGGPLAVGMVPVHNGVGMKGFAIPASVGKINALVVHDNGSAKTLYRTTFPAI